MAAPLMYESGDFSSWTTDYPAVGEPSRADMAHLPGKLGAVLAGELSGAAEYLEVTQEEILLAALARAISRTIGDGTLSLDLDTDTWTGRGTLPCAPRAELPAAAMLSEVRRAVRIATGAPSASADIRFSFRSDTRGGVTALLALHASRNSADDVTLDWWYDTRSFAPNTIDELAEQFPLTLAEITSEAAEGLSPRNRLHVALFLLAPADDHRVLPLYRVKP